MYSVSTKLREIEWKSKTLKVFATYKCDVVCGSSFANSSSLSPTEVHFTITRKFSKKHVQFPAFEHKTTDSKWLPSLPRSCLGSPLKLRCDRSWADVAEITKINKTKT